MVSAILLGMDENDDNGDNEDDDNDDDDDDHHHNDLHKIVFYAVYLLISYWETI